MKKEEKMMSFEESRVFLDAVIKRIRPLFSNEFKMNAYEHPFYPTDNPWDFIEIWNTEEVFGVRIHWPRKWHEHCIKYADEHPRLLESFFEKLQGKWQIFQQEMAEGSRCSDDWTFLYPEEKLYSYDELKNKRE